MAPAAASTYAGIVRLAQQAAAESAPVVRLADRVAAWFLPLALAVAGFAWLMSESAERAVIVTASSENHSSVCLSTQSGMGLVSEDEESHKELHDESEEDLRRSHDRRRAEFLRPRTGRGCGGRETTSKSTGPWTWRLGRWGRWGLVRPGIRAVPRADPGVRQRYRSVGVRHRHRVHLAAAALSTPRRNLIRTTPHPIDCPSY